MLEVHEVSARYGDSQVLHDLSLSVQEGDFYGVLGANGAGKTSFVRVLLGLVPPEARGSVRLDGEELVGRPPHTRTGAGMAVVPEGRRMFSSLSVKDSLLMGAYRRGRVWQSERTDYVLSIFPELADRMAQPSGSLSGGQQQMVAVGRALMSKPRILLLDEPSLGLAPVVVQRMFDVLRELHAREAMTIVLIEQNARETFPMLTRAVLLERGRAVIEGTRAEVEQSPLVTRAYLGNQL